MRSFPKKVLRTALDRFFDQYGKITINRSALEQTMCHYMAVQPNEYSRALKAIGAFLAAKVEKGYLLLSKGRAGGYLRVKDWSAEELAHLASERDKVARGFEIKRGIIAGLEAQIATVSAKPARSFIA